MRANLLNDLVITLAKLFEGYSLPNFKGVNQQIKIFPQYLPQPNNIQFSNRKDNGLKNYDESDFEANFPCIVVKLEDLIDVEENARDFSSLKVKIICGITDKYIDDEGKIQANIDSQGYQDILNIQEKIRTYLLQNRVFCKKYLLKMPLTSRLLESDSWPVYFGEIECLFETFRPNMGNDYIYRRS